MPALDVITSRNDDPHLRGLDLQDLVRLGRLVEAAGYSFTTITPKSHATVNARPGNEAARNLRDVFGWSRPFPCDLLPFDIRSAMEAAGVLEGVGDLQRSRVRFSALAGSLYMHSAFPTLATDAVFFGPDTYKFVDAIDAHLAQRAAPILRAVDICTGAGPGALTIARAAPDADVFMVDINPQALRYAAVNAVLAGCANARTCLSDKLTGVDGVFDLIVAHPPYLVDRQSRAYRHGGGALGADLGLAIVRSALERLAPGGTLLLFTGIAIVDGTDLFKTTVTEWLDGRFTWSYREVDPDVFGEELAYPAYANADRIALVVLEATRATAS